MYWSQQYDHVCWLDSNNPKKRHKHFDAVLAVGAESLVSVNYKDAFNTLKSFKNEVQDWLFGYFSYDLKNDIESLDSSNYDGLNFPDLLFFQAKKIFFIKGNRLHICYLNPYEKQIKTDLDQIKKMAINSFKSTSNKLSIKLRIHKDDYFSKINSILNHLKRGDIYEVNFCQEFYSENCNINPVETYYRLNTISKPPFATFLKLDSKYVLSASPERYLKRNGSHVISQPIKGTAKRSENVNEDKTLKRRLKNDNKERAENIMIVDLVRNDLSRVAIKGSVIVEELCEVYSFKQVHQLISTVACEVNSRVDSIDIIKATFPMGSMTGAPKISAMRIIEALEETKRGLYSGAVGYFSPNDDFDFNVVIRSILYDKHSGYVSYSVGGAITAQSDAKKEYEECLIKAKAMRHVLEN